MAGEHVVERSLRVPLEFRNIPEALEIVGDPPDSVDVRLRGSSALLEPRCSRAKSSRCSISAARAPGSRLFHIRNDEVRAPFGVEVAQVMPATLALELEKSARRTVPVVAGDRRRARAGLRGRAVSRRAGDGGDRRPGVARAAGRRSDHRAGVGHGRRARVRDGVTIGVMDSSVRLAQAAERATSPSRSGRRRSSADAGRAGALAESRHGLRGAGLAAARPRDGARRGRGRWPRCAPTASRPSWTLPGSGPAGTICGFRSTLRSSFGVVAIDPAVVSVTIK